MPAVQIIEVIETSVFQPQVLRTATRTSNLKSSIYQVGSPPELPPATTAINCASAGIAARGRRRGTLSQRASTESTGGRRSCAWQQDLRRDDITVCSTWRGQAKTRLRELFSPTSEQYSHPRSHRILFRRKRMSLLQRMRLILFVRDISGGGTDHYHLNLDLVHFELP